MTNSATTEHVHFSVVTTDGLRVDVELRLMPETVEVWRTGACVSVIDRGHLRAWAARPTKSIGMGEVTFTWDRSVDRDGRIAITMPGVDSWTLDDRTLTRLTRRL